MKLLKRLFAVFLVFIFILCDINISNCISVRAEESVDLSLPIPVIEGIYHETSTMYIDCKGDFSSKEVFDGYEIAVSLEESFADYDSIDLSSSTSKKYGRVSYSGSYGKTYYVRARAYKGNNFGQWSAMKTVEMVQNNGSSVLKPKYNYEVYLMNKNTNVYNSYKIPVYVKTDNPDLSTFFLAYESDTGKLERGIMTSVTPYADIPFLNEGDVDQLWNKVPGGYIGNLRFSSSNTYKLKLVEMSLQGNAIAGETDFEVLNYSQGKSQWEDAIIEQCTNDSMDTFEKMESICDYLLKIGKYHTTSTKGTLIALTKDPNAPFFETYHWDSIQSPAFLLSMLKKIDPYAIGKQLSGEKHAYIEVTIDDTKKQYHACPYSNSAQYAYPYEQIDTTNTDQYKKIPFTEPEYFTGVSKLDGKFRYIVNGEIQEGYNGQVEYNGRTYDFVNGYAELYVSNIMVYSPNPSIYVGNTKTITVQLSPVDATDKTLTWESSDETIATVDQTGVITAISPGKCVVTVRAVGGVSKNINVTCLVNPSDPTPSASPSATPSTTPSEEPSATPTITPSVTPSEEPSASPSVTPSATPSEEPSATPTITPSVTPGASPTVTSRPVVSPPTTGNQPMEEDLSAYQNVLPVITKLENQSNAIRIQWKKMSIAHGYMLYRKIGNGSWTMCKVLDKAKSSYIDKTVDKKQGVVIQYMIFAYRNTLNGMVAIGKASAPKEIMRQRPQKISKLSVQKDKRIKATWKKAKGVDGYELQYAGTASFAGAKKVTIKKASHVSAKLPKLKKGKKLYVRIRTYKTTDSKKLYSTWGTAKKITGR